MNACRDRQSAPPGANHPARVIPGMDRSATCREETAGTTGGSRGFAGASGSSNAPGARAIVARNEWPQASRVHRCPGTGRPMVEWRCRACVMATGRTMNHDGSLLARRGNRSGRRPRGGSGGQGPGSQPAARAAVSGLPHLAPPCGAGHAVASKVGCGASDRARQCRSAVKTQHSRRSRSAERVHPCEEYGVRGETTPCRPA
jgi:hypothetical protein